MNSAELEAAVEEACTRELEDRGMRRTAHDGLERLERELSPGITGIVSLPVRSLGTAAGGYAVLVSPVVRVQHEETRLLVSVLRGFPPDDANQWYVGMVGQGLASLVPEKTEMRREWVAVDSGEVAEVARKVADDVVFYGYPYLERLRSADAFFEEMKLPPHNFIRGEDLAVMHMVRGQFPEARKVLMTRGRPLLHTEIGRRRQDFLEAFEKHFGVDLEMEKWPEKKPKGKKGLQIAIRDRGVVRNALLRAGREDLADHASLLSDAQLKQIGDRATALFHDAADKDPDKAIESAVMEYFSADR